MSTRQRVFGLLVAILSVLHLRFAWGISFESSSPRNSGMFGAISSVEGRRLQNILGSLDPSSLGEASSLVARLRNLNVEDPNQLALLAPMSEVETRTRLKGQGPSSIVNETLKKIDNRQRELSAAAQHPDAGEALLAASVSELGGLRAYVSMYRPENVGVLDKEQSQAEERLAGMRAADAAKIAGHMRRTAEALGEMKTTGVPEGEVAAGESAIVLGLVKGMRNTDSNDKGNVAGALDKNAAKPAVGADKIAAERENARMLVDRLQHIDVTNPHRVDAAITLLAHLVALAAGNQDEILQHIIVQGLVKEMQWLSHRYWYVRGNFVWHLLHAFEMIATKTSFENIQELVVHSMMETKFESRSHYYKAWGAVERVTLNPLSNRVREFGIRSLVYQLKKTGYLDDRDIRDMYHYGHTTIDHVGTRPRPEAHRSNGDSHDR